MNLGNVLLLSYAIATSLALIFLKLGSQTGAPVSYVDNKLVFNLGFFTVGGILLYGVSFLIYTFLIAKYDLGFIIPLATALVYVVIFIASFIIFKESFGALKIGGIILILVGIILLNMGDSKALSKSSESQLSTASHQKD